MTKVPHHVGPAICGFRVCHGYVQFQASWFRAVLEWSRSVANLRQTDAYGPVYHEANALIANVQR